MMNKPNSLTVLSQVKTISVKQDIKYLVQLPL